MQRSTTRLSALIATAATACVMMAVLAGSAIATPVNATWTNPTGENGAKLAGSIVIKQNGKEEKTCSLGASGATATSLNLEGEGVFWATRNSGFYAPGLVYFDCTGSTKLWLSTGAIATYDSGYKMTVFRNCEACGSPYGTWVQEYSFDVPFTNASGGTPSHITFSETTIGEASKGKITASGTLNITTKAGGELTLTH